MIDTLRHWLFRALLLACVGTALVLSGELRTAWDFSRDQRNALSARDQKVLAALPGQLSITVIAPDLPLLRAGIERLLERYRRHRPDLQTRFIDATSRPELVRRLGIRNGQALLVKHRSRSELAQGVSEAHLSAALERLALTDPPWVVFASDQNGATPGGKGARALARLDADLAQRGFLRHTLSLEQVGQVPDNTDLLVLAGPEQPLKGASVGPVRRYLATGSNLLWLVEGEQPALQQALGIELMPGRVVDANAPAAGLQDPRLIPAEDRPAHAITRQLGTAPILAFARALKTRDAGWQLQPLLRSSDKSWNETGSISGAISPNQSDEKRGPLELGFALTRTHAGRQQRVVVIGDADFLADAHIGRGANLQLARSLFSWLAGQDQLADIPPRLAADRELSLSPRQIGLLAGFWLVLLPLLLAAMGIVIRARRVRR